MTDVESALSSILAAGLIIILFVFLLLIAWLVFYYVGVWKLYKKAGRPGWNAIVPFYNDFVLVEMVGLKWYWFLIDIIVSIASSFASGLLYWLLWLVSIGVKVNIFYNMSKKFGKDAGWIVLMTLFSGIMLPIYGYNKAVWNANAPVTPNGLIDGLGGNNAGPTQGGPVVQGVTPVQPQPVQPQPVQPQPVQPEPVAQSPEQPQGPSDGSGMQQ